MKHDDGMTMSGHTGDTAGGGRGIFTIADGDEPMSIFAKEAHCKHGGGRGAFSNAHRDVPMSFLQRRTSNTHRNDDSHHNHDTERRTSSDAKQQQKAKRGSLVRNENKKEIWESNEGHSETSFDVMQNMQDA